MTQFKSQDYVLLAGRALMAGIFLMAGMSKFKDRQATVGFMKSQNLPFAPVLAPIAGTVEIGSAVSLITGYRPRLAAVAAMGFLIPTTLIFHGFWKYEGQERQMQQLNFLKNLAIIGGLMGIVTNGAGSIGIRSRTTGAGLVSDLREELPQIPALRKAA